MEDFTRLQDSPIQRRTFVKRTAGGLLGLTAASSLMAACGGDNSSATSKGPVTVSISNSPDKGTDAAGYKAWSQVAQEFMKKEPKYKIVPNTLGFDPSQFYTQYVAGKAADCFQTFYDEMPKLIQQKYAYDIDSFFRKSSYVDIFLPENLQIVTGPNNHVYGLPYGVYGQGMMYNRTLFKQAGLDPDKPPTTWDDFREYAKRITDKTGKTGFVSAASGHTGGWHLVSWLFTAGGEAENVDGSKVKTAFNSEQGVAVLQMFHNMRFVDKSMAAQQANFDHYAAANLVATNKAAMCISGSPGNYFKGAGSVDFLGLAPMPQNGGNQVLGGGNVWVVNYKNARARPEMAQGAFDYTCFTQYDLTYYEETLKAQKAANPPSAIGIPDTVMFTPEYQQKRLALVEKYANLPVNNYKAVTTSTLKVKPEPKYNTQELYATLDSVLQAVITKTSVDFKKTLDDAAQQFQSRYLDNIQA